jgi:polyisoprenyl-teichoic acid--peptidoglycan teichoic acid transferase
MIGRSYNIPDHHEGDWLRRYHSNWFSIVCLSALAGVLVGYLATLVFRPSLLPPALRFGSLNHPMTVLFLGVDVVYTQDGRTKKADKDAFNGRSDTIMLARLDPYRNTLGVMSIPRDTQVVLPRLGMQKINAANALGGPQLAMTTVQDLLQVPIDHYVILNVHGLVSLVDELGGITVEIPKRMRYMDWTAKLKIDLEPGFHTLTGNQAMGFVRFRHDALGDIGRVERQQIFIRAILDKAMRPEAWLHLPRLVQIAQSFIDTDMSVDTLMRVATFVRGVPKQNQHLAMMPGRFSGTGDWLADHDEARRVLARLMGSSFIYPTRDRIHIVVINQSSTGNLGFKLYRVLKQRGYHFIAVKNPEPHSALLKRSRIIAQLGNNEEAELVRGDLNGRGDVVNASVGDIESGVTVLAGDDLAKLGQL